MMDHGMISKIEKSMIYSQERERIEFQTLSVTIRGDNDAVHSVNYNDGAWKCDCEFFEARSVCSHTMTMERVLQNMVELGDAV